MQHTLTRKTRPAALLLLAIKEARSSGWTALAPARRLAIRAHGDAQALRAARAHLKWAAPGSLTRWQARALATLDVAIGWVEMSGDSDLEGRCAGMTGPASVVTRPRTPPVGSR